MQIHEIIVFLPVTLKFDRWRWNGVYWIHPDVCQSVCPFVCRQGFPNFLKKLLAQFISYLAFTLMGWASWPLFIFVFLASFLALWWPNIWPKMGFPEFFEKNYWPNSFNTGHLSLWGESLDIFVLLASFLALWWPNIWPQMGFSDLVEKTIGSIHFIPGIYPYGVSLLTPIHFRYPSLIFGPLVAKYLAGMGFPELFEKTIGSIHFIPGIYPYGVSFLTPVHFRVPSLIFGPLVAKYLAGNGVSGTFWKNYWLNSFHTGHLSLWGKSLDPYTFWCF